MTCDNYAVAGAINQLLRLSSLRAFIIRICRKNNTVMLFSLQPIPLKTDEENIIRSFAILNIITVSLSVKMYPSRHNLVTVNDTVSIIHSQ